MSTINTSRYDNFVDELWIYAGDRTLDRLHAAFGLSEEAGEVMGKYKRAFRDAAKGRYRNAEGYLAENERAVLDELGDVAYYLTRLCHLHGSSLNDVLELNMEKLRGRKLRGTLVGEGDNR